MEAMIYSLLDDAINDICFKIQTELDINYGDIEPLDAYELCEKEHELAMLIGKIIRKQKGEDV